MLRLSSIASICLILILAFGSANAAPKMQLSEQSFDFGFVPQRSSIAHKFTVTSTGSDSLKILKVIPGCGCTKAPIDKTELAVGESTDLEIIFDTKSYNNKVTKAPRVMTNESPEPTSITFSAYVVPSFEGLIPLNIRPHRVITYPGEAKEKFEFNLTNETEQPVEVALIDYAQDFFSVDLPKSIKPNETVTGIVHLKPGIDNSKQIEKSLTIEVNDQKKSRYTIPVIISAQIVSQH